MRGDTPASEMRSNKRTEQAEGRVPQIPRRTGSAEKGLPGDDEGKTRKEVEEKQTWQEAKEAEHSI